MKTVDRAEKKAAHEQIATDYRSALDQFLSGAGEAALQKAYEIGRRAVNEGVGVVEMALLHCNALDERLSARQLRSKGVQRRRAATQLFLEGLAAYEMAYRGVREANLSLRRINELLEEQERKIARTIHDQAGQLLIAVNLELEALTKNVPGQFRPDRREGKVAERVAGVIDLLRQIQVELRNLSHELQPTILEDLGLAAALQSLADRVSKRAALSIGFESSLEDDLSAKVEFVLYRVVQEALANAIRHAQASSVKIHLRQGDSAVCCSIRDDGVGFEVEAVLNRNGHQGLGLKAMRERVNGIGGSLQIKSILGQGTEFLVSIPLERPHAAAHFSGR